MSAVFSFETPKAVIIITDGAIYDRENVLLRVERKVDISQKAPAAIAARGNMAVGEYFSGKILDAIERMGFDATIDELKDLLPKFADNQPNTKFELTIAGISEEHGPRRVVFRSDAPDLGLEHRGIAHSSAVFDAGIEESGARARALFEPVEDYIRAIAIPMMQHQRDGALRHRGACCVGGQIDFTVVSPEGVTVETIYRWDDKIGARITPLRQNSTVVSFPGMSRQQRRAAERALRKTA